MKKHSELELYRHTNKVQAEEIGKLRTELQTLRTSAMHTDLKLQMVRIKHQRLLEQYRAFKVIIRTLSAQDADIEWQEEPKDG